MLGFKEKHVVHSYLKNPNNFLQGLDVVPHSVVAAFDKLKVVVDQSTLVLLRSGLWLCSVNTNNNIGRGAHSDPSVAKYYASLNAHKDKLFLDIGLSLGEVKCQDVFINCNLDLVPYNPRVVIKSQADYISELMALSKMNILYVDAGYIASRID
jgi:hypothetical protein